MKYLFKCLYHCCIEFCKAYEKASRENERKADFERKQWELNNIENRMKDLESEHNKIDRTIHFGNPLNDPGYQQRKIDHYDYQYQKEKEHLEWEAKQIQLDMKNNNS